MTIDKAAASAALDDISRIVERVKQSRVYRTAANMLMLWGVIVAAGYMFAFMMPRYAGVGWLILQAGGTLLTIAASVDWGSRQGRGAEWRFGALMLLILAFGTLWSSVLGHFGPREMSVFWPTIFMFCYAVAGLWFGRAFVAVGLVIAALSVAGYLWTGPWLDPYLAVTNGGGLVLCGFLMRRA